MASVVIVSRTMVSVAGRLMVTTMIMTSASTLFAPTLVPNHFFNPVTIFHSFLLFPLLVFRLNHWHRDRSFFLAFLSPVTCLPWLAITVIWRILSVNRSFGSLGALLGVLAEVLLRLHLLLGLLLDIYDWLWGHHRVNLVIVRI